MSEYERILVTLDGSSLAERAVAPAVMLAQRTGAELVLLRVAIPIYFWAPFMEIEPELEIAERRHVQETESYLEGVKERLLEKHPELRVKTVVLEGPVAERIVDYATGNDVDLIVMSSHGRSGISRWLYGSVAERVLQGARCCSTLVVRGEGTWGVDDEEEQAARGTVREGEPAEGAIKHHV